MLVSQRFLAHTTLTILSCLLETRESCVLALLQASASASSPSRSMVIPPLRSLLPASTSIICQPMLYSFVVPSLLCEEEGHVLSASHLTLKLIQNSQRLAPADLQHKIRSISVVGSSSLKLNRFTTEWGLYCSLRGQPSPNHSRGTAIATTDQWCPLCVCAGPFALRTRV